MSTLAMVEQVMRQTKTPMSVRDIVEVAGEALPTRSKTPDTVVARDLSVNIKKLGKASRFVRTAPGRYTLREFVAAGLVAMGATDETANTSAVAPASVIPALASALKQGPGGVLSASATNSDKARHESYNNSVRGRP